MSPQTHTADQTSSKSKKKPDPTHRDLEEKPHSSGNVPPAPSADKAWDHADRTGEVVPKASKPLPQVRYLLKGELVIERQ